MRNLSDYAAANKIAESVFKAILRKLDFTREQFDKEIQYFSGGQKKKSFNCKKFMSALTSADLG